jgi:molybdopterin-guanine dinucleotide biosynthesis protein A
VALAPDFDAVVPLSPSGPEPLCAVYGRACLDPVRRRLEAGDFKMTSFWPDVRIRSVPPVELAVFGDPSGIFRNVNAPADYEAARAATSR